MDKNQGKGKGKAQPQDPAKSAGQEKRKRQPPTPRPERNIEKLGKDLQSVPMEVVDEYHRNRYYVDQEGVRRFGERLAREPMLSRVNHPYFGSPLILKALQESLLPDRVGPLGNVERESTSGNTNPREGTSKRAAFALFNHYYTQDNSFLVSGEQERWDLQLQISPKGYETGLSKPDVTVEVYSPEKDQYSDLIMCEVKRADPPETYAEMLDQISEAAHRKISPGVNEHIFASVLHGPFISFFAVYDVEQNQHHYKDLVPLRSSLIPKEEWDTLLQEAIEDDCAVLVNKVGDISAYAFNLLKDTSGRLAHECFIEMTIHDGPIDPEV